MKTRKIVIIGIVGSVLDAGFHAERWQKWRPSVSLARHPDLPIHRFELIHAPEHEHVSAAVAADIKRSSETTEVRRSAITTGNPWDFEEVYSTLYDFAQAYEFHPETEDYLVHITNGTHVQQICLFLLTESRHFPARLIQTSPSDTKRRGPDGRYNIIDLDLSRYDRLAQRFVKEHGDALAVLKSGIATRNERFNRLIEQLEYVAAKSREPILLLGPTGAGKTQLARRIYELKKARHQLKGEFVEMNCATLRGDAAMSALFGHVKGSFTGAVKDRPGLLRAADGGLLFLDEVGELGLDEQAMLLRALEEKRFLPVGSDRESTSDFQLIAGTNTDLAAAVRARVFREDLLARLNLWTFRLPGLSQRVEDIEPNLDYELQRLSSKLGTHLTMNREAREAFLEFAMGPQGRWTGNFRDFGAALTRMATLATGGRINIEIVKEEIGRLKEAWAEPTDITSASDPGNLLREVLGEEMAGEIDLFDQVQLAHVIRVVRESTSAADAGRTLFAVSREKRKMTNDSDRLAKYLARFGLTWKECRG
ncbi:MAG TPA: RNA repair transcriptional activator RtcR [Candidatus Limnocylindria bacterium]|nr:RNA repair transcriptional activator RtcR [Candidatus Limnocylindria bacterium]